MVIVTVIIVAGIPMVKSGFSSGVDDGCCDIKLEQLQSVNFPRYYKEHSAVLRQERRFLIKSHLPGKTFLER